MSKKHLIMGTAGHVDHGKTTLIKALTGFDCDTHKQEKKRGITINLGFTHLDLPSGNSLGIVDMPGHADFINTMVSGASGIDFVLLIIAADEGVMPQTVEHLEIMKLLEENCLITSYSTAKILNFHRNQLCINPFYQIQLPGDLLVLYPFGHWHIVRAGEKFHLAG